MVEVLADPAAREEEEASLAFVPFTASLLDLTFSNLPSIHQAVEVAEEEVEEAVEGEGEEEEGSFLLFGSLAEPFVASPLTASRSFFSLVTGVAEEVPKFSF